MPGFLAAQVDSVAAETGWPEEQILFMPLARLGNPLPAPSRDGPCHYNLQPCCGVALPVAVASASRSASG